MANSQPVATALLSALILLTVTDEPAYAQTLNNQSPGQMRNVVREALANGTRVSAIQPKILKNQVVFDVMLIPNPDETGWMTLLNLTPQQLTQARARYGPEGYTIAQQTSINANGQNFISTIWLKTKPPISTLVLPTGRQPEKGERVEHLEPIDKLVKSFRKTHNAAGVTLAMMRDGQLVYERAFGWANANERQHMELDTPMRIADISKTFTAIATMQLVEKGRVKADAAIVPLLKQARFRGVSSIKDDRWNQITIQHLLQHRGGWDAKKSQDPMFRSPLVAQELKLRKDATAKDVVKYQLPRRLDFKPGSQFGYSNFGYCLLGRVIEIADDRTYGSTVLRNILKPLELKNTKRARSVPDKRPKLEAWYHMQRDQKAAAYWTASQAQVRRAGKTIDAPDIVRQPDGVFQLEIMDSTAGWTSTAGDLARFFDAIRREANPLVEAETLKQMLAKPDEKSEDKSWYGAGLWVQETDEGVRFWHGGSMAGTSSMTVSEANGIAWAVLFNTDVSKESGKPLAAEFEPLMSKTLAAVQWPSD
ncbi:MAG: serine hydrolase domain-containing protein [Planctomycetaceae bacterium]